MSNYANIIWIIFFLLSYDVRTSVVFNYKFCLKVEPVIRIVTAGVVGLKVPPCVKNVSLRSFTDEICFVYLKLSKKLPAVIGNVLYM